MKFKIPRWRLLCVAGILVIAGYVGWRWTQSRQPSVLLITLDTTRADRLGCYGHASAFTPVLDKLAQHGVLFEHAITSVPLTLPSHATMLTGRLPPEHGLRVNGIGSLPKNLATLPELFHQRGYRTGAFIAGFVLERRFGLSRGFDHYDDQLNDGFASEEGELGRRRPGNIVVDRVLKWLHPGSWTPFFCWMHLYDPHHPCQEHRGEFGDRFAGRGYDAELAFADRQIGRVIDELQKTGRLHDTLIIVVGDHGEGLGEHSEPSHGHQIYDSTLQVPFLIHWPARFTKPQRVAETVGLIDLFPTVLDCVGVVPPSTVSGRSLRPALEGRELSSVPYYAETYEPYFAFNHAWQNGLVHQKWKLIHSPVPELYNLAADPHELQNLIEKQPDQRRNLETLLLELKSKFRPIKPDDAQLDAKSRQTLASLGYSRQTDRPLPPDADFGTLPDVKDAMVPYQQTEAAMHLRHQGKDEQAEELLRKVVEAHPRFRYSKTIYAETLAHRALDLPRDSATRLQKLKQAESLCREIIAEEQSNKKLKELAATYMVLAEILSETGRFPDANTAFDQAAHIEPEWAQLYFGWGLSLEREGRSDDALQKLGLAADIDSGLMAAHLRIGDLLLKQSQSLAGQARDEDRQRGRALREQALQRFLTALRANPQFVPAAFRAFTLLEEDKQWARAATLMQEVLQSNSQSVDARYLLGQALARQEKFAEAAEQFRQVLERTPQHPGAQAFLKVCEQQLQK